MTGMCACTCNCAAPYLNMPNHFSSVYVCALLCPALAGYIVLCSWQDTLLSQCLSPPRCLNGNLKRTAGGNPAMD